MGGGRGGGWCVGRGRVDAWGVGEFWDRGGSQEPDRPSLPALCLLAVRGIF